MTRQLKCSLNDVPAELCRGYRLSSHLSQEALVALLQEASKFRLAALAVLSCRGKSTGVFEGAPETRRAAHGEGRRDRLTSKHAAVPLVRLHFGDEHFPRHVEHVHLPAAGMSFQHLRQARLG